jgi:hypothetical protein
MLTRGTLFSIPGRCGMRKFNCSISRRLDGQHAAFALLAVIAICSATTTTARADCGPDAPSWCRCVYVELPPELSHLQHLWQPVVAIPSEFTPVETSAGSLIIHQLGVVTTPPTFLVAPPVPVPELTTLGPSSVESFVVPVLSPGTFSPSILPTFTAQNLSPTIQPTTPWTPSGVLEYNATLTVVLPDMSYFLPAVPEPATTALLLTAVCLVWSPRRRAE